MPISRFGLSVGQFSMLGIWLIDGRFKEKVKSLLANKAALVLISFYFLHVLGLLYTTDYQYAFKDLRVKLPLLFLPIVFVTTKPLNRDKTNLLLLVYIASVVVASLISLGVYFIGDVRDFRDLSPFISHIRLSLNVCLAIFFAGHFAYSIFAHRKYSFILLTVIILWLFLFLIMIESVTGLIIVWIVLYILLFTGLFRFKNRSLKIVSFLSIIAIPLVFGIYLSRMVNGFIHPHKNELKNLELYTSLGNLYHHDTIYLPVENGNYVGLYVCEPELRNSWNELSNLAFDGHDEKGQELKYTLIRYLNSKELRKDSKGVSGLSTKDIRNIEKGIANFYYTKPLSIHSRLYKLLWEYQIIQRDGNPGGHSVAQRFEFWKVSLTIIKDNFMIGVGTGDIRQSYADTYEQINSMLEPQFRHRAHNQFLAIFVTFGVIGLLWFLISLIYPALKMRKVYRYRYAVFWITMMLSMLVEDTLETQMGVTLFAFFNALLLFGVTED